MAATNMLWYKDKTQPVNSLKAQNEFKALLHRAHQVVKPLQQKSF